MNEFIFPLFGDFLGSEIFLIQLFRLCLWCSTTKTRLAVAANIVYYFMGCSTSNKGMNKF